MSQHFYYPGQNLISYFRNRELNELYVAVFLKALARSLVLIFVPVYLWQIGFSIRMIGVFFLLELLGIALATPLGLWLNHRIGLKKAMVIGDLLFVGYMFAISLLKAPGPYLIVPTIISSISSGLFFAAYHVDFTLNAERKEEATRVSIVQALMLLGAAAGPLIGSLVISSTSFGATFLFAAGLSFAAMVPLFFSKDIHTEKPQFSWVRLKRADKPDKVQSYMAFGAMQVANEIFWPLFIYITLRSLVDLGAVVSLSTLFLIVAILWFGRHADRFPRQSLKLGVWLHAPSWIVRIFTATAGGIFFINLYAQLTYQLFDTVFEKIVYAEARKSRDMPNYFLFRQVWIAIGRIVVCLVVIISGNLWLAFALVAIAVLWQLKLKRHLPKLAQV